MSFADRLDAAVEASGSLLCVGLDPDGFDNPAEAEQFCVRVLDATLQHVCAVKANLAFFEQFGSAGYAILERLRARVPAVRILILDGKRGDIGNTAEAYARALIVAENPDNLYLGSDGRTLRGHRDSLARPERGAFLVTRSSNPGAADLFDTTIAEHATVYSRIVELGLEWDPGGAAGFVVGTTEPSVVAWVRRTAPEAPLLLPGVGAQGGALEEAVRAGLNTRGGRILVAISRAIADAPEGPDVAAAAFRDRIAAVREVAASA